MVDHDLQTAGVSVRSPRTWSQIGDGPSLRWDRDPDEGWPEKLGFLMAKGARRPAGIIPTVLRGGLKISCDLTLLLGTDLSAEVEEGKCRWEREREEGHRTVSPGVGGTEPNSLHAGKGSSDQDN